MTDFPSAETNLMQRIHDQWGSLIAAAVHDVPISSGFLAALVAGESGGNPAAARFEGAVFAKLMQVCMGRVALYPAGRPLGATDILGYVMQAPPAFIPQLTAAADLATSFGLTQIMGWHMLELYRDHDMQKLKSDPQTQLEITIILLVKFANAFQLNTLGQTRELFTCWNAGSPTGKTFDPNYAANGQRRIQIYETVIT
jgi:hypothetical protein